MTFWTKKAAAVFCVLFMYSLCVKADDMQSLTEAIDIGTSKEFDKMYNGKGASVQQMLDLFHKRSHIEKDYINKVFLEAADVNSIDELGAIQLDTSGAVDFINKIIKHFQKNPNAGQIREPIIVGEDSPASETNDEFEDNLTTQKEEL
uniref:Uncharacterized protein LOC100182200 n=1 Tax=Phallusia mammillata TaxID=59560 RepID=A0A6F9DIC7_9ASCI|nr:uncharacterized protein LOC100182200 [Phallusia mammillata]